MTREELLNYHADLGHLLEPQERLRDKLIFAALVLCALTGAMGAIDVLHRGLRVSNSCLLAVGSVAVWAWRRESQRHQRLLEELRQVREELDLRPRSG